MTTAINDNMLSLVQMETPQPKPFSSSTQVRPECSLATTRLPSKFECAAHIQLLNAIVRLKITVDNSGQKKGMPEGQAWKQFCETAAAKFLVWSKNVDTSGQTIPVPSLDILMVWHSFMLNPTDYMRYANQVLQGRLGGKGIDWRQLVSLSPLSLES